MMSTHSAQVLPFPTARAAAAAKRQSAYAHFKDALQDFSDDPTSDNAVRYLATSRDLDESRHVRSLPAQAANEGDLLPAA